MKEVKIENHEASILIDDEDLDRVSNLKWYFSGGTILSTSINRQPISIQNFVKPPTNSNEIDHRDRNIFNNQKDNLRECTHQQNCYNRSKYKNNTSGYKGVTWCVHNEKWISQLIINGKKKHLGLFDDAVKAAERYDRAAKYYFGEFANLNFPETK